jgi:hypothetical protein
VSIQLLAASEEGIERRTDFHPDIALMPGVELVRNKPGIGASFQVSDGNADLSPVLVS